MKKEVMFAIKHQTTNLTTRFLHIKLAKYVTNKMISSNYLRTYKFDVI